MWCKSLEVLNPYEALKEANMHDLKPCPCCGGEARHYFSNINGMHLSNVGGVSWGCKMDYHVIRCYKCGLQTKVYATVKGCYKAWNRRAGEEDKHEAD